MKQPTTTPRKQPVLIKWTGSKRLQADTIISRFPKQINTYYEPFIGSGAMLWKLLDSKIRVRRIECSDTCRPLIDFWNIVKEQPDSLLHKYAAMRAQFVLLGSQYYYEVRQSFNRSADPYKFFFLLTTCRLGQVRFNKNNEFNSPVHHGRIGIEPQRLESIVDAWHSKLKRKNVSFRCRDYRCVRSRPGDLLYLDPPYEIKRQIYGRLNLPEFYRWLAAQNGDYLISLNGFLDDTDRTIAMPAKLFKEHIQVAAGLHHQDRLGRNRRVVVTDSLYIKATAIPRRSSTNGSDSAAIRNLLTNAEGTNEPAPKAIKDTLAKNGIFVDDNLIKVVRHNWRREIGTSVTKDTVPSDRKAETKRPSG